ncbi:MAG TPA: NAD(+) diphosphatase [Burkholderiaceae bacterium]
MLSTPQHFQATITAPDHANPVTLVFRGDELLMQEDGRTLAAHAAGLASDIDAGRIYPVGILGETYFRTTWVPRDAQAPGGHAFHRLRNLLFGGLDEAVAAVACRAYQIAEWARTHRFCGACATPTHLMPGERCMTCPSCGHVAYPRISPAMMVLIRKGNSILLARNVAAPAGRFSALAGFLEAGESIEEAVHREVFEEVGLKVHNLRYFASQPWSFPHSLMIAYVAEYLSGEIRCAADEIAEAHWYGPEDELPAFAPKISIAGELITSVLREIGHVSVRD